ncbi:hypothetical protein [Candidatus Protochlamydia phocaeensis]|uniref:hypothetical protein n=1 Tax=Candidatus Protochlamydia phocaeensis TaxID=1414722 RepID=UPI000837D7FD|nr:hypothetical protein [Candidatus Protochlamydia phocaeensis]
MSLNINPLGFFSTFNQEIRHLVWREPSPFEGINNLNDLERVLLSEGWNRDKWRSWKKEIQKALLRHQQDPAALNAFLANLIKAHIHRDPQETLQFFSEVLSLEALDSIARFRTQGSVTPYQNAFEWAAERAARYPLKPEPSFNEWIYQEWKRCRPRVIYFIPNLINIFLGAFNFLDTHKKFTTLWEKHILLEIIYKFFIIPFCLVQILQPIFIVTAKVYLVAGAILAAGGLLAIAYQRWFKPIPDEIVNCTNLDKQMDSGLIEPKVGQTELLTKLLSTLITGANVLLVGKSGDGKTTLFHQLLQLKKEGKLPAELQDRVNYEVDCGLLISNVSFGHSELINQIKDQIGGYEKKTLFLMDEFDQLASNQGAFQAFKNHFLQGGPNDPQFIATTTFKEFEKIKKLDVDGSFMRRVVTIIVDGEEEEQNKLVLEEFVTRVEPTIPVTEEAIRVVLDISKSETYLPNIGRPAKAIKIMKEAIGRSQWVYNPTYTLPALDQAVQQLKLLKAKMARRLIESQEDLQAYRMLSDRIVALKEENAVLKDQIKKIKQIKERELTFKDQYFKLTHQLAAVKQNEPVPENHLPIIPGGPITPEAQKLYLLYHFYGAEAFEKVLEEEMARIENKVPVRVNEALVRQVFEEIKAAEARVIEQNNVPQQAISVA